MTLYNDEFFAVFFPVFFDFNNQYNTELFVGHGDKGHSEVGLLMMQGKEGKVKLTRSDHTSNIYSAHTYFAMIFVVAFFAIFLNLGRLYPDALKVRTK